MPVEIRELVIRATVLDADDNGENVSARPIGDGSSYRHSPYAGAAEDIWVRDVLRVLARKQER